MNPGPVEEAGKVASGFMTAMSSQPVMLGMVVCNLALIGMLWFTLRFAQEARKAEFEMIFGQQKEVQELLARCVVPDRRTESEQQWLQGASDLHNDKAQPAIE